MFRIYLKNKLEHASEVVDENLQTQMEISDQKQVSRFRRNRRLAERYSPNHHQLSLMNGQDILHVNDLSATGFNTTLAEEAIDRFEVGNIYEVKLKARKSSIGLQIKVIWQDGQDLGFRIEKQLSGSPEDFRSFIFVFELAASLHELTDGTENQSTQVFYGLEDSSLQIWRDSDGQLESWTWTYKNKFVRWGRVLGIETGHLSNPHADALLLTIDEKVMWDLLRHDEPDQDLVEFGFDIVYAWQHPLSREILQSVGAS